MIIGKAMKTDNASKHMRLSVFLLCLAWIPLLQLVLQDVTFYIDGKKYFFHGLSWFLALPGLILTIKIIFRGKATAINRIVKWCLGLTVFFGIPVFFTLNRLYGSPIDFNRRLDLFQAAGFAAIYAVILGASMWYARKEALQREKPFAAAITFVLAAISLAWMFNLALHFFHELGLGFSPGAVRMEGSLLNIYKDFVSWRTPVFIFYILLLLLFFGELLYRGKLKENRYTFLSLMGVVSLFITLLITGGLLLGGKWFTDSEGVLFPSLMVTFLSIIGPIMFPALVLMVLGGLFSLVKKTSDRLKIGAGVRRKGIITAIAGLVIYVVLFQHAWPFRDPAARTLWAFIHVIEEDMHAHYSPSPLFMHCFFKLHILQDDAVLYSLEKLESSAPRERSYAHLFLQFNPDKRAVEPLLEIFSDKESGDEVVGVLAAIPDERAVAALGHAVKNRALEAYSLDQLKFINGQYKNSPQIIEPLIAGLDDEDSQWRESTADVLRFFKTPEVKQALKKRLKIETDTSVAHRIKRSLSAFK